MPRASLSVLLCRVSVLVRLFLANVIGQSAALLGVSFLGNHIPSFTHRGFTQDPYPMHLFLAIASLSHHRMPLLHHFLMIAFAVPHRYWYMLVHIHSLFEDVSFLSGLHTSAAPARTSLNSSLYLTGLKFVLFSRGWH